jgi:predicted lipoprotein with Yx(FWY)xxD motif
MQRRQITLADGRYLIFYTFDEEAAASSPSGENAGDEQPPARVEEPNAEPQATEEQGRV